MNIGKKLILACALTTASACGVAAQALTVEDYCDPARKAPKAIREMRPMSDGLSYACIGGNGKTIDVYSYKTGQKTSTIFDVAKIKGDVKIDQFSGYTFSNDEKKILLWNDVEKIYRRSFRAEYYVYDVVRGTMKRVSDKGKQNSATLSHDGRMVAYQRDNNVWISNLDYGTDRAITEDGKVNEIINGTSDWVYEEEFSYVNTMRWSADDNTLAYIRFDESRVPVYRFDDVRPWCISEHQKDFYPQQLAYKYPLPGYPNSIVSVKAYNLDNRTTKTMDLPIGTDDYVPSMEFDGAGTSLMVMIVNRDQNHLRLFKVNPGSTVGREIMTEKVQNGWLNPDAYQTVHYGAKTFVIASQRSGWQHLYEYDYQGTLRRQITNGDFNVKRYYGRNSLGEDFFACTKLGGINLNVAKTNAKGVMTLLHNEPGTERAAFSRNFQYYVRTYSSATVPPQYTIWATAGKKIAELEMNADYASRYAQAPKMEFLKIKNNAGQEMDAYIIKPQNASGKAPLLMYQYNGPGSQTVMNEWRMDGIFWLASQGYMIACVDGRGTALQSREYEQCVYRQLGKYEVEDQITAARFLGSRPDVDENRMACWGWSYGGYMTLMELTDINTPFKAGVAMAAPTDWRYYDSIWTERFMSTPQQNEAGYEAASAMNRSQRLRSRLLIMSGTSDDNVHFYNTLKYTSKLQSEGKIFDMMAFTGFEHSMPLCNARVELYKKMLDFLNIHLK